MQTITWARAKQWRAILLSEGTSVKPTFKVLPACAAGGADLAFLPSPPPGRCRSLPAAARHPGPASSREALPLQRRQEHGSSAGRTALHCPARSAEVGLPRSTQAAATALLFRSRGDASREEPPEPSAPMKEEVPGGRRQVDTGGPGTAGAGGRPWGMCACSVAPFCWRAGAESLLRGHDPLHTKGLTREGMSCLVCDVLSMSLLGCTAPGRSVW